MSNNIRPFNCFFKIVVGIIEVGDEMESFFDVQQFLKKHGTIIYTKDREMDLFLMEEEFRQLHEWGMVDPKTYQQALLIIRMEKGKLRKKVID